jgi:hypothetical protein
LSFQDTSKKYPKEHVLGSTPVTNAVKVPLKSPP